MSYKGRGVPREYNGKISLLVKRDTEVDEDLTTVGNYTRDKDSKTVKFLQ